jgi:hypothetical protein
MSIPAKFENLTGEWHGTNKLYTSWIPDDPIKESKTNATVRTLANGKFLQIQYDWVCQDKPQDGVLLLSQELDSVKVVWIDSWHNGDKFMNFEGKIDENGALSVNGFYAVPENPDWGWRIDLVTENSDSFVITMHNISPENEEDLAVNAIYRRK